MTRPIKFCVNCGDVLTGKQRSYCSDRCRKAYSRKADNSRTNGHQKQCDLSENLKPVNVFALFADSLTGLDTSALRMVKEHLLNQAKYSDVNISRLSNQQWDMNIKDKVTAQQALSDILWRMVDDIGAIENSN